MAGLLGRREVAVLVERLKALSANKNSTDFTIVCGSREWKVHKTILALHSAVFEKVCYSPFKEASNAKAEFVDEDADIVDQLIKFCYTFDFDMDKPLTNVIKVSVMADKYDVLLLCHFLATKLNDRLYESFGRQEFTDATEHVYNNSDACERFKRKILHIAMDHRLASKSFRELMQVQPQLTADIAECTLQQACGSTTNPNWQQEFTCPNPDCGAFFSANIPNVPDQVFCCFVCQNKMDGESWQQFAKVAAYNCAQGWGYRWED